MAEQIDYNGTIIVAGSKIWRPVSVNPDGRKRILNVDIEETPAGSRMIRAIWGCGLWTKNFRTLHVNTGKKGVVCFFKGFCPEAWTYFVVTGISKNGKACFVKPISGDPRELLDMYGFPTEDVEHQEKLINTNA